MLPSPDQVLAQLPEKRRTCLLLPTSPAAHGASLARLRQMLASGGDGGGGGGGGAGGGAGGASGGEGGGGAGAERRALLVQNFHAAALAKLPAVQVSTPCAVSKHVLLRPHTGTRVFLRFSLAGIATTLPLLAMQAQVRDALQRHRKVVFFAHHQARTLRTHALEAAVPCIRGCSRLLTERLGACGRAARPYPCPSLPPYYPAYRQVLIDGVQHGALADVPHVRIDGGSSAAARHEAVTRFQRDAGVRAALVGITVGGTALTLTAASVATPSISLDLPQAPSSSTCNPVV